MRSLMPKCRGCGCDELHACIDRELGPCCWVESDLCSHCVVKARGWDAFWTGLSVTLTALFLFGAAIAFVVRFPHG